MSIRDLLPQLRKDRAPVRHEEDHSLFSFQREMNRLFDDFFGDAGLLPTFGGERDVAAFSPTVNVSETGKEVTVSAELPGLDEKDIAVEVEEDRLTLSGEKREESEEKGKNWHRVEHRYGSFRRVVPLPASVDAGKARAKFKKGVLTVSLPKREEDRSRRKTIEIKTE